MMMMMMMMQNMDDNNDSKYDDRDAMKNTGNTKKMHYVDLQNHQPDSLRVGESYEGKMIAGKCL